MATGCMYYKRQDGTLVPLPGAVTDHGLLLGRDAVDAHPQYALAADLGLYVPASALGQPNGVATLNANGHVPNAQLALNGKTRIAGFRAACSAAVTPSTTTMVDLTGAALNLNVKAGDVLEITAVFDVAVTVAGGVGVGGIFIAGGNATNLNSFGRAGSTGVSGGGFIITMDYDVLADNAALNVKSMVRMGAGAAASGAQFTTNSTIHVRQYRNPS
jgi:hypothetical protein